MWRGLTIAVALALLWAAPASARDLSFLRVGKPMPGTEIRRIVDEYGRTVLLRGVNVNGLVDYWDADEKNPPPPERLRPPYPNDPSRYGGERCPPNNGGVDGVVACRFDFGQMRGFGYSVVRLAVSWSLLEPQPGKINRRYVDRIAQIVGWAKRRGIYVVLDMHQDAWSKFVYTRDEPCTGEFQRIRGFDGAPLWASRHTSPSCALHGVRELNPAVGELFQRFWLNTGGLQDHYTEVLVALAKRFHKEPAVAGYELMNEPHPGYNAAPAESEATQMFPYWGRAVDTVVARVKGFRQLFFVEPSVERNVTDAREAPPAPWSTYSRYRHVVYAPHVYTGVFTADQTVASERFQPMVQGYNATQDDARALGLPLWIGEFGNDPADDATLLAEHYALQDYYLLGGALWLWKENDDDNAGRTWGVYRPPFGRGVPKERRVLLTSRATPIATAGNLRTISHAPQKRRFDIHAGGAKRVSCGDRKHATVVFVPRGVPVTARDARLEIVKRGSGREVFVYPDGGKYRVYSGSARKRTCPKN